jgi:hypothetical protein
MNVFLGKWAIYAWIQWTTDAGALSNVDDTFVNQGILPSAPELIESVNILHGNSSGDELFKINAHAYTYFRNWMIWMKWTEKYGFYKEYTDKAKVYTEEIPVAGGNFQVNQGFPYPVVAAGVYATEGLDTKLMLEYINRGVIEWRNKLRK